LIPRANIQEFLRRTVTVAARFSLRRSAQLTILKICMI